MTVARTHFCLTSLFLSRASINNILFNGAREREEAGRKVAQKIARMFDPRLAITDRSSRAANFPASPAGSVRVSGANSRERRREKKASQQIIGKLVLLRALIYSEPCDVFYVSLSARFVEKFPRDAHACVKRSRPCVPPIVTSLAGQQTVNARRNVSKVALRFQQKQGS